MLSTLSPEMYKYQQLFTGIRNYLQYVKSICVLLLTGCFRSGIANGELLDPYLCYCFGSRLTYYFIIRHFPVFFDMVEKGSGFILI